MNLVIDIGNTIAKIAVFRDGSIVEIFYDSNQTLDADAKLDADITDAVIEKLEGEIPDATEAAIFGDKTAVDEETVRLRSHIAQYRSILELDEPVGRKLDFLTQELNRETNTIGSKCQDLDITRIVVDMKAEIEKIREQIQNLE